LPFIDKKDAPNEKSAKGTVGKFRQEICRLYWLNVAKSFFQSVVLQQVPSFDKNA